MKEVDFSIFVFVNSTGVLVKRTSNIHAFAEMAGKKIAVVAGTTNERAVADQVRRQKLDVTLVMVKDRDEGVDALEAGKVDGFASNKLLLAGAQVKKPDALVMLPDDLSIEQYAIVLPRGDWALRLAVNTGLAQIFRSGRTVEMFERWFFGARPGVCWKPSTPWEGSPIDIAVTMATWAELPPAILNGAARNEFLRPELSGRVSCVRGCQCLPEKLAHCMNSTPPIVLALPRTFRTRRASSHCSIWLRLRRRCRTGGKQC